MMRTISLTINNSRSLIKFYSHSAVRVRFAPSPTGYLHVGGLRTALYNYLFAKSKNGVFILRIEDTDQSRLVDNATVKLIEDLKWCGINYDEGPGVSSPYGPYIQSERGHLYQEHVNTLLENGCAYKCFCSSSRLDILRREAIKQQAVPKYDNKCRELKPEIVRQKIEKGEPYCIRFKLTDMPEPFHDIIYGPVTYNVAAYEGDPVIIKQDGFPTYHFANVVDDHLMNISHVLRGVEWQISTPKHILMYQAFNWNPPQYGHLPLILNTDGTKVSKRQGDVNIEYFRKNGFFPNTVINFVTQVGGGFNIDFSERDMKTFTLEELVQKFDVSKINTNSCKLLMDKLEDINRLELSRLLDSNDTSTKLVEAVQHLVKTHFNQSETALQLDFDHVLKILNWATKRINRLRDFVNPDLLFLWTICEHSKLDKLTPEEHGQYLQRFNQDLIARGDQSIDSVSIKQFCKDNNVKFAPFMKLLRLVLSGLNEGPGIVEMINILGRETTSKRIQLALKFINRPVNERILQ